MNARAQSRETTDDLRFYGFCTSDEVGKMMEAKTRKKGLTISEYLSRLVMADVVKDAEVGS